MTSTEHCYHGPMQYKTGVSKDGRLYRGWFCSAKSCDVRWEGQRGRCRDLEWTPGFNLLWQAPSDCCDCPQIMSNDSVHPIKICCQRPTTVTVDNGTVTYTPVEAALDEALALVHKAYGLPPPVRERPLFGQFPIEAEPECNCYISPWGGRVPLEECPVHGWGMDLTHDPDPTPEPYLDDRKALRYGFLAVISFMAGLLGTPLFLDVFHIDWAAWLSLGLGFVLAQVFAVKGDNA